MDPVQELANRLLQAVESGSAPDLMDLLTQILQQSPKELNRRGGERLELLQGIALQMRLDLHAMLAHIYHRLEATRAYLELVRHLAGEGSAAAAKPAEPATPAKPARSDTPAAQATRPHPAAPVLAWPGDKVNRRGEAQDGENLPSSMPTAIG
ncbi:MAG: hypothetical protein MUF01_01235 [Bryobacterales bacterium]|nr:hypothetical protein [Bryobacterales bacterium]